MKIPNEWMVEYKDAEGNLQSKIDWTTPIIQADIDREAANLRGQYQLGKDTREFFFNSERNCRAWNCWMLRDVKGNPVNVSEPLTNQQIATFAPSIS